MAFTLFASIQGWIQSLCGGAKQRLRQWTRPYNSNDSLAVGTALDLTRSKSELVLENALLRQQLIVLRRQGKRPTPTWRDRVLFVPLVSKLPGCKTALMIIHSCTGCAGRKTTAAERQPVSNSISIGLLVASGCSSN